MGYFFRKSAKIGPFRLNFSKSGVGASVGVKGARLTVTPRGTTYVTVGSHGFYYRESISNRSPRQAYSDTPPAVVPTQPRQSDEIVTADVSDLVDSSSEALIEGLNERARMFNPAWLVYICAVCVFIFGVASGPESSSTTAGTPPLTGVDYSTLVARFGYPNSVLESNPLGVVTERTAFYTAANTAVVFVQEPSSVSTKASWTLLEIRRSTRHWRRTR